MEETKKVLLGMTLDELKSMVTELGMPAFTAKQIASWMYDKRVRSIEEMTNISKANRELLEQNCTIGCMDPIEQVKSKDGTVKYLFPTSDGKFVETVYIPDHRRATLCISCQVGCKMNCVFCHTGKQGFEGNLSVADILNQIYYFPASKDEENEKGALTNIVYMGQGEPFDNLDNVLRSTEILTASYGWAWSPKRITVSSCGLKKGLMRFLDESQCNLAISLHSPIPEQREMLMPAEKAYSIKDMIRDLARYDFSHQRRLSFEYTVFKGLNDSQMHVRELIKLLKGLDCRINLIRYHNINKDKNGSTEGDVVLETSDEKRMEAMRDYLSSHGVFTTIRTSRGEDIWAACGLLSTAKKTAGQS